MQIIQSDFHDEIKEVIVLVSELDGSIPYYESHKLIQSFLAYIDVETNELKNGDGRLVWLILGSEYKGLNSPFKNKIAYRLKVRKVITEKLPENGKLDFYNQLMVVEIIEENVHQDKLIALAEKYNEKIETVDEELGTFELIKKHEWLTGDISWLGHVIQVTLIENEDIYEEDNQQILLDLLRSLVKNQEERDLEFRKFASQELTDLANDWREQDFQPTDITEEIFAKRLSITGINLDSEGNYSIFFHDDDMFWGHSIVVDGHIVDGITDAQIYG